MATATEVGYVEMRIAKVVGLAAAEDEPLHYVVLQELAGDRQLAIAIGQSEAFSLAARLGGIAWPRPMTYQFAAGLVQALGGRVRQVQIGRWWRRRISPPRRWKGRSAWSRSTRGPATR
jgi:bifunctional DNase/RNase